MIDVFYKKKYFYFCDKLWEIPRFVASKQSCPSGSFSAIYRQERGKEGDSVNMVSNGGEGKRKQKSRLET